MIFQVAGLLHAASVDSLRQALAQEQDTVARISLLNRIVQKLRFPHPAEAMTHAREELQLARLLNDTTKEMRALAQVSDIYFIVKTLPNALEAARELEQLATLTQNHHELANAYTMTGNVYYYQEDWNKAREYYEKALVSWEKSGIPYASAGPLNNIAVLLIKEKKYEQAEANLMEAMAMNKESKRTMWEVFNLLHLADIEAQRGNPSKAVRYLERGREMSDSLEYREGVATFNLELAELERKAGRLWEARQILEEYVITDSLLGLKDQATAYRRLSTIYKESGSFRKAFRFLETATELQDSLDLAEMADKLSNIESANAIRIDERVTEMTRLREASEREGELQNAKLNAYIYLLGLLVVVALAFGLLIAYRIKRRSNRILFTLVQERTQALEETHEELNTFMYRSSHEIRGAINSIQGLYDLALNHPGEREQAMELLGTKILQLEHGQRNLIYTMELRGAEVKPVELELRKVVEEAIASVKLRRQDAKVDFRLEIPGNVRVLSDRWMLSIVVENLIDNAVVFRDPDQSPWCRVTARQVGEEIELKVEDNGIGIAPEVREQAFEMFYRGSMRSAGSGLGLYNVQLAIEKLNGKVSLAKKPGKGTLMVVQLPKRLSVPADA